MSEKQVEDVTTRHGQEVANLAGGCFWCLEAVFEELAGVNDIESGYMGGDVENPSYEQVCTGTTGHAEVVRLRFDPGLVSFRQILEIFFSIHDPTTLNRQGADVGSQYRSAIFHETDGQRRAAEELITELENVNVFDGPIVTEVVPAPTFYPAGEYHRAYYRRNSSQSYCQFVIAPKLAKFRRQYLDRAQTT
jgi:peptide-methionine (S)-S-oxide reductase